MQTARKKLSYLKRLLFRSTSMEDPQSGELSVGSVVQIGNPPRYGVLKWTGTFPGSEEIHAGIELDEAADHCGDGKFEDTQYFSCDFGHGYFCLLEDVQLDQRFLKAQQDHNFEVISTPPTTKRGKSKKGDNPLKMVPLIEEEYQGKVPSADWYVGEEKGIQGHYNSCYLDSTLFGLFALSDAFDSIFLGVASEEAADPNKKEAGDLLAKRVVNPLRKNGAVRFESVMELRKKIEEIGKMKGVTKTEKDPEEVLNLLFKHVLHVSPFIFIKREAGIESEFFIQLFMSFDENLRLPTMKMLVKQMFDEFGLSLTKVPSRLLIQVPRYGRQFKTCQRIVPDMKFDVLEFTDTYKQAVVPECMICDEKSSMKCSDCKSDFLTEEDSVHFCSDCSSIIHKKKKRRKHVTENAVVISEETELDLLSVICIETSHYVCFTRDLNTNKWIFFDSMADRVYDEYNIPRVTDCTRELNEWVYSGDRTRLMSTQPRQLPELVRRFTQDIYMCVYVNPDVALSGDNETHSSVVI